MRGDGGGGLLGIIHRGSLILLVVGGEGCVMR